MTAGIYKPKYKCGQWVRFRKGGRILSGCISNVGFTDYTRTEACYEIGRSKQIFRNVYERNILEGDKVR